MKEGWTYKKLGEVCEIQYGTRVVQSRDGGSTYPVYGGGGATFKMDSYNRENCLVVARFAMSKQCTRFVNGKFFLNDSGLTLNTKDKSTLLQSYLDKCTLGLNDDIFFLGKGMAQKNLDMKSFRELVIKYPNSLQEQQQIVSELDLLSSVIEKQKAQIEELDKLAQSIFYDMFGDPEHNNLNWKVAKLSQLTKSEGGGTPSKSKPEYWDGDIVWVSSKDMKYTYISDSLIHITQKGVDNSPAHILPKGTILIVNRSGILKHTLPVAITTREVTINQDIKALVVSDGRITNIYLLYTLKAFSPFLLSKAKAVTVDSIDFSIFKNLNIPIPPLSLQQEFANKIQAIESMKAKVRQSLKESETLFNSRMDFYFS